MCWCRSALLQILPSGHLQYCSQKHILSVTVYTKFYRPVRPRNSYLFICHFLLFVLEISLLNFTSWFDLISVWSSPHITVCFSCFSFSYHLIFQKKLSSPSLRSHPSTPLPCLTLCFPPPHLFCCLHMSDVLHVYLSQTKMSAARTTAAASTSASTQWALTFVSVAMALYCMRTNMTVRKVGFTYIHIRTHTGIKTLDRTCTSCHIHTSMWSFTRTATVHHTARTLFIHIRVTLTTDWPFPFERIVFFTSVYLYAWWLHQSCCPKGCKILDLETCSITVLFNPGPYVYMLWCVNVSYLPKVWNLSSRSSQLAAATQL